MPVFPLGQCPVPPPDLVIENAQFIYQTNFEGRAGTYNDEGERSFNVRIPDNIVDAVVADNWNVKWTKPKDESYEPEPYLQVNVGFKYRPPHVEVIDGDKSTLLTVDEKHGLDTVKHLDTFEFQNVDLVIRGRAWENTSGCGIKAWLKTFVGVLESDDVRRKYAHLRD